jgi:hypothetical protein
MGLEICSQSHKPGLPSYRASSCQCEANSFFQRRDFIMQAGGTARSREFHEGERCAIDRYRTADSRCDTASVAEACIGRTGGPRPQSRTSVCCATGVGACPHTTAITRPPCMPLAGWQGEDSWSARRPGISADDADHREGWAESTVASKAARGIRTITDCRSLPG